MTLVQREHVRVVVLGHGDHGLANERPVPGLVHAMPADTGGGGAGPVDGVPGPVVGQALD